MNEKVCAAQQALPADRSARCARSRRLKRKPLASDATTANVGANLDSVRGISG